MAFGKCDTIFRYLVTFARLYIHRVPRKAPCLLPSQIRAVIQPSAPFSPDESKYQIVLPEDLHPLVMSVQSFESALGDLHQEYVFFIVVM